MGAIVISTDAIPPYIKTVSPPNGYDKVGVRSAFVIRAEDRGGSFIDLDTVEVSINGSPVISSGEVVPDTEWDSSKITPWSDGETSLLDIFLSRNIAHSYEEEITVTVVLSDNSDNSSSRTLVYTVEKSKEYDGTSISDLSELEASFLSPFSDPSAEKFRSRILYGILPGATVGTSEEVASCRRAVQLLARYGQAPFVAQYWPSEVGYSDVKIVGSRSLSSLEGIAGQFSEASRQALSFLGRKIDSGLRSYVEGLLPTQPVAASLCLLAILCKQRDIGSDIK
jgi:hypothetical protein